MGYKEKSTGCNIDCLVPLEHQTEENNLIRKGFLWSGLRCDKAGPVMVSLYFGFFLENNNFDLVASYRLTIDKDQG